MTVGSSDLFDVQELRDGKRLFVLHCGGIVGCRLVGANGHGVARRIQADVARVDAGKRYVNTPPIVRRGHLEGWRIAGSGANWKLVPELIEDAFELALESKEIID